MKSFALGSLPSTPGSDIWGEQASQQRCFCSPQNPPNTAPLWEQAWKPNPFALCGHLGWKSAGWGSEAHLLSCPFYTLMLPSYFASRKLSQGERQWETEDGNGNPHAGTNKGIRGDEVIFPWSIPAGHTSLRRAWLCICTNAGVSNNCGAGRAHWLLPHQQRKKTGTWSAG